MPTEMCKEEEWWDKFGLHGDLVKSKMGVSWQNKLARKLSVSPCILGNTHYIKNAWINCNCCCESVLLMIMINEFSSIGRAAFIAKYEL